jgi:hypothetical protein
MKREYGGNDDREHIFGYPDGKLLVSFHLQKNQRLNLVRANIAKFLHAC